MSEAEPTLIGPETAADAAAATAKDSGVTAGPQPLKPLPSTRTKLDNQLVILRSFAAASGPTKKAVQNGEVAKVSDINISTISSCNRFFADVGLLEQQGRGYVPAPAVFDFQRTHQWDPEKAPLKLAPVIASSWLWEALEGRLSIRSMSEDDVIHTLADAVEAPPSFRQNLEVAVDLLVTVGLAERDGNGMIKLPLGQKAHKQEPKTHQEEQKNEADGKTPPPVRQNEQPAAPLANAFSFAMTLSVPMNQLSQLSDPKKVEAFFAEWAHLVNAKAAIERMLKELPEGGAG